VSLLIKICGLTTAKAAEATTRAGADMAGFVFFEKSPRHLSDMDQARAVAAGLGTSVAKVALTVDASDEMLREIVSGLAPDYLQLHGTETAQRVREVKNLFNLPVIKACPISDAKDVEAARLYQGHADLLLFDAKPPTSDPSRPGGMGAVFDWSVLAGTRWTVPWLLAGGLTPETVGKAVSRVAPGGVDVSSGVETSPGKKSPELIERFVAEAHKAQS